jgi:hypothetical protein
MMDASLDNVGNASTKSVVINFFKTAIEVIVVSQYASVDVDAELDTATVDEVCCILTRYGRKHARSAFAISSCWLNALYKLARLSSNLSRPMSNLLLGSKIFAAILRFLMSC